MYLVNIQETSGWLRSLPTYLRIADRASSNPQRDGKSDPLFRFYRRNPSTGGWDIFKAQRNRVVWLQSEAKMEYFHQLLCKKSHPSHIWNSLKLTTASSALPENWSSCNSNHLSSIGFCLSLFFSSLNLTFSLSSTTVMLSGQGASSPRLPGWRPSSTMPATLSFVNVEGPPHRLLIGN